MGWGGGLSPSTLITLEHMVMVRGGSSERLYVLWFDYVLLLTEQYFYS